MTIAVYKKALKHSLRPRTLLFLMKEDQVLLGLKKRGHGKGYWLGIGGKVEEGESIADGARREVQEEIHVNVLQMEKIGLLDFYFPHINDESWNQQVYVYISSTWEGKPEESNEMKPQWFNKEAIPYKTMWDDSRYWISNVIAGKKFTGEFLFDDKLKVLDYRIDGE